MYCMYIILLSLYRFQHTGISGALFIAYIYTLRQNYSAAEKESACFFYILAHNFSSSSCVEIDTVTGYLLRVMSFGQWVGQPHPFN